MALKLNIRPEIEKEMDVLFVKSNLRSKTEYINEAIREYNQKLNREWELAKLRQYFKGSKGEEKSLLDDFSKIRPHID